MKKTFKRAGVAVLSMAMLLSMGAMTALTSNAAGGTLSINVASSGVQNGTVNIYKVAYHDGVDWKWVDPFKSSTYSDFYTIAGLTENSAETKTLASELVSDIGSTAASGTITITSGKPSGTFTGDATYKTYYLVTVSTSDAGLFVQPSLVEVDPGEPVSVNLKGSTVTINKTIEKVDNSSADTDVSTTKKSGVGGAGSVVDYRLASTLPEYAAGVTPDPFYFIDTPGTGITINKTESNTTFKDPNDSTKTMNAVPWAVSVWVDKNSNTTKDSGEELTVTNQYVIDATDATAPAVPTGGFTIEVLPTVLTNAEYKGKPVYVDFKATINNDAVAGTSIPNDSSIKYANEYATGKGSGTKPSDTVYVHVAKLQLVKYKSNGTTVLSGAKFKLYKGTKNDANLVGKELETNDSGIINFEDLDVGTYVLEETYAPAPYVKVGDITFTITGKKTSDDFDGTYQIATKDTNLKIVTNNASTDVVNIIDPIQHGLPGTGGMGTVLFTVGGAAIVLLAGVLFVVYMRKRKVEE